MSRSRYNGLYLILLAKNNSPQQLFLVFNDDYLFTFYLHDLVNILLHKLLESNILLVPQVVEDQEVDPHFQETIHKHQTGTKVLTVANIRIGSNRKIHRQSRGDDGLKELQVISKQGDHVRQGINPQKQHQESYYGIGAF